MEREVGWQNVKGISSTKYICSVMLQRYSVTTMERKVICGEGKGGSLGRVIRAKGQRGKGATGQRGNGATVHAENMWSRIQGQKPTVVEHDRERKNKARLQLLGEKVTAPTVSHPQQHHHLHYHRYHQYERHNPHQQQPHPHKRQYLRNRTSPGYHRASSKLTCRVNTITSLGKTISLPNVMSRIPAAKVAKRFRLLMRSP